MKKLVQCQWGSEAQNFVNKKLMRVKLPNFLLICGFLHFLIIFGSFLSECDEKKKGDEV